MAGFLKSPHQSLIVCGSYNCSAAFEPKKVMATLYQLSSVLNWFQLRNGNHYTVVQYGISA